MARVGAVGPGFRGAAIDRGLRVGAVGPGFRGAAIGRGVRVAGFRGAGWGPGWRGRRGWGWGWPVAVGFGLGALSYPYYASYYADPCLEWNGYAWVNTCYAYY